MNGGMRQKASGGLFTAAVAILRIAIGWHFLYEGLWKLMQSDGWSCVSYLGAAQGPLAPVFTWMSRLAIGP